MFPQAFSLHSFKREFPSSRPRCAAGSGDIGKAQQMELFDDRLLSKKARLHHRIIGQLFDTYWLVEYDEKFYIIDQHAAHEKSALRAVHERV